MGGDEIIADWLGDLYSKRVTTIGAPQRFEAASKRFRNVYIQVYNASDTAWIGKYHSGVATFIGRALRAPAMDILHYEFVDLYDMGFSTYINPVYINILGINEY